MELAAPDSLYSDWKAHTRDIFRCEYNHFAKNKGIRAWLLWIVYAQIGKTSLISVLPKRHWDYLSYKMYIHYRHPLPSEAPVLFRPMAVVLHIL